MLDLSSPIGILLMIFSAIGIAGVGIFSAIKLIQYCEELSVKRRLMTELDTIQIASLARIDCMGNPVDMVITAEQFNEHWKTNLQPYCHSYNRHGFRFGAHIRPRGGRYLVGGFLVGFASPDDIVIYQAWYDSIIKPKVKAGEVHEYPETFIGR